MGYTFIGAMFETSFQSLWGSTPGLGKLVGRGSGGKRVEHESQAMNLDTASKKQASNESRYRVENTGNQ